ncbi:unnamed protein product [Symbiodinium sp. KB8]|nr:unnamed protein product [Symbiodinium sp. KB8]
MAAIAKYEVLSAFADGRADGLADILESARLPGHAYFTDGWHLSDQGMRAVCNALLADLAEAKQVKGGDGGRLVNSLVSAPVHPAWGKGFYRGGFCRHLWKVIENKPGKAPGKVLLVVAGNDCLNEWCTPEELRHEIQYMRQARMGRKALQLHVLDVVPLSFLQVMAAIAKYEVLSAFADGRAEELADILECARLPGARAACNALLADLAEGFNLVISDSTLCAVEKEKAKQLKGGDGGRLVNSLVSAPVHPAWGKGFYRGGFCRHLWKVIEKEPGKAPGKVLLVVAGNDCLNERCTPEELRHEMQYMRQAYEDEGVQLHVLDVVPLSFLQGPWALWAARAMTYAQVSRAASHDAALRPADASGWPLPAGGLLGLGVSLPRSDVSTAAAGYGRAKEI